MSKLCKLISLSMALVFLFALGIPQVYAAPSNINDFAQTCTFDDFDVSVLDPVNTSDSATVTVETVDGDNAVKVDCTGAVYPWFYMYSGAATVGNLSFKFDFKTESTNMTFGLRARFADKSEPILLGLDHGSVDCLGNEAVFTYSKNIWYNVEVYIDNRAGKALLRFKEDSSATWSEKWIDDAGSFISNMNSNTGFIGLYMKTIKTYGSTDAAWYIDNYSHTVSSAGFKNLNTYFGGYAETATFSESEDVNHYVFIANAQTPTLAVDPEDAENKVLNIYDAEKGYPWVGPYAEATGSSDTLQMTFDFYDANGNNAYEFVKLLLANNSQPFAVQFKKGKLLAGIDEMPIYDDNGEVLSYDANKWYTITIKMNWQTNYLQIGFKEKGAADYRWATNPFYADFVRITSDNVNLSQIRIGYSIVSTNDVSFYIDNYSHTTAEDAVAIASDVTMAMLPKALTTKVGDVTTVTGVESYAMTLSGEEKTVTLLVALYDELGRITDVKLSEVTCSDAIGTPVTVDLTGETFASWRGFVIGAMEDLCPLDIVESARW